MHTILQQKSVKYFQRFDDDQFFICLTYAPQCSLLKSFMVSNNDGQILIFMVNFEI